MDTVTIGGTWVTGDEAHIDCNGKRASFVVGATQTVAAVVTGLKLAWNASTMSEHAEVTAAESGSTVTLTADEAGVPFTVTAGKTSTSGTISVAVTVVNAGPAVLSTLANFSGGALPGNGDTLVFEQSANDCLYDLEALAAVTGLIIIRKQSYTGLIGLPLTNAAGRYIEYRPRYLKAGVASVRIGEGDGNGSGRFMLNANGSAPAIVVSNCGTQQTASAISTPAVLIIGTAAGTTMDVVKGTVGVALLAGETAVIAALRIGYMTSQNGDSTVTCGSGVTLTTIHQTGGKLSIESNVTTFTQDGGEATIGGTATVTALTIGGSVYDTSSGTITTASIRPAGVYDHRRSLTPKTITNVIPIGEGGEYHDPYSVVTASGGWTLNGDVVLDIGFGKTLHV